MNWDPLYAIGFYTERGAAIAALRLPAAKAARLKEGWPVEHNGTRFALVPFDDGGLEQEGST